MRAVAGSYATDSTYVKVAATIVGQTNVADAIATARRELSPLESV
jgi:hypothetical protein